MRWPAPPRLAIGSYYETIRQLEREILEASADLFMSLAEKEDHFWSEYRNRVMDALQNAFYTEVVRTTRLKRKAAKRLEPRVRDFDKVLQVYIDTNSSVPDLWSSLREIELRSEDCVFRSDGDFWTLSFKGKMVRLKHMKGFLHIHFLLANPDEKFDPLRLVQELEKASPEGTPGEYSQIYSQMTDEQLEDEFLSKTGLGDAGMATDKNTIAECISELKRLSRKLDRAEKSGDSFKEAEILHEADMIQRQLGADRDLFGKIRLAVSVHNRARDNVRVAGERALEKIRENHEPLWRYLHKHIEFKSLCYYEPDPDNPIDWNL